MGDDKLVSVRGQAWELYDLSVDRSEMNNLVNEKRDLADDLEQLWYHVAEEIEQAPAKFRKPVGAKSNKQ